MHREEVLEAITKVLQVTHEESGVLVLDLDFRGKSPPTRLFRMRFNCDNSRGFRVRVQILPSSAHRLCTLKAFTIDTRAQTAAGCSIPTMSCA